MRQGVVLHSPGSEAVEEEVAQVQVAVHPSLAASRAASLCPRSRMWHRPWDPLLHWLPLVRPSELQMDPVRLGLFPVPRRFPVAPGDRLWQRACEALAGPRSSLPCPPTIPKRAHQQTRRVQRPLCCLACPRSNLQPCHHHLLQKRPPAHLPKRSALLPPRLPHLQPRCSLGTLRQPADRKGPQPGPPPRRCRQCRLSSHRRTSLRHRRPRWLRRLRRRRRPPRRPALRRRRATRRRRRRRRRG
mmetsp:Transcript_51388/g.111547  ORF Transcript_51388/g.111547 Transcript_51388/m.111547 type:complete len:244 (+) Transcript_51388:588-1319(+)